MADQTRVRRLSRIRWLCRRGMKELDVLLERFCRTELDGLYEASLADFEALLQLEDPDLYEILIGGHPLPDSGRRNLVARINRHRRVA